MSLRIRTLLLVTGLLALAVLAISSILVWTARQDLATSGGDYRD
jgi:hypothetical protein